MLPADDVSYGFDNIAGVQRMSPTLMERYLAAAQKISSVAVGASPRAATTDTFLVRPSSGRTIASRACRSALAAGPRCATPSRETANTRSRAVDAVRRRQLRRHSDLRRDAAARAQRRRPAGPRVRARCQTRRDRASDQNRRTLDADWQVRFPAKAGPRTVALTFLNRTPALLENLLEPSQKPVPGGPNGYYTTQKGAYLRSVEISGPFNAAVPETRRAASGSSSAGRRKHRTRRPARRRFSRRWLDARSGGRSADADLQTLLSFYKEGGRGDRRRGFEIGIERAVEGLLVSPEFLFRIEREPPAAGAPNAIYRISDLELASRLSFFLWSSIPDDALLEAASSGKLRNPAVLEQQVAADAGRSARRRAGQQFRRAVAVPAKSADGAARSAEGPRFRRRPAAGIPARNRAALPAASSARIAACSTC